MSFGFNQCTSASQRFRHGKTQLQGLHKKGSQKRLLLERLEPRIVLAGDLVISEFLAENTNGLIDEDQDHVDWIELYNDSNTSQDLSGWHITNDNLDLNQWTFPAGVSLAPGEFLLMYASGKDRTLDPSALHTNFEINEAGGFLALIQADGTTIEHSYDPYPAQLADVSFGIEFPEPLAPSITLTATADIWVRELEPNTSYENDFIGVWSGAVRPDESGLRRYGLLQFDVSSLAGEVLSGASLDLYMPATNTGSSLLEPINQTASVIDISGTGFSLEQQTWNTIQTTLLDAELLESLGSYDVGATATTPEIQDQFLNSPASANDLEQIEFAAEDGTLTLLLTAVEDGTNYKGDWGDGEAGGEDAVLNITLASDPGGTPLDLLDVRQYTLPSPSQRNEGGSVNTLFEGVFITEFMAVNNNTLNDEDGDSSDWLEIYNANTTPVDLSGWQLTDDPTHTVTWTIPAGTTLGVGEFLLVFASGKNRAVAGSELHTDFSLSSSAGEYLALLDDVAAVQHEYTSLPEQFADITYGIQFGELPDIGVQPGDVSITASADSWIRESGPTTVFENDLMSVWSSAGNDGARRYGVVEFDVSALAGESINSATLKLWAGPNGFSDDNKPIKQTAVSIDTSGGTQTTAMTWNAYQTQYDAGAQVLESLGTVDFDPNNDGGLSQFVDSIASIVDLATIQTAIDSANGLLTIVMIADEDGTDYAKSWGDQGFITNPAVLEFNIGGDPPMPRRTPLDPTSLFYFTTATQLAPNLFSGVVGFIEDTKFSVDRGFFESNEDFDLSITTATVGAEIYYTTNGSNPSPTNPVAVLFDPLFPIHIDQTSTIRAAAFVEGFAPTNIDTQTYIFLDDVITQSPNGETPDGWPTGSVNGQVFNYGMDPDIVNDPVWGPQLRAALESLSTFSIVTDLDNLVDPATGLYVNAGATGKAIERPASIELINPDGTTGFQIDAGIRPRGNFSASGSNPKHAFRLFFREEYGEKALNYPLFGDEGVDRFRKLDLRTAQNDSWAFQGSAELTFIHDVFARDLQRDMGQPYTRSRYHHLYINGVYWGLYQSQERAEANYGQSYLGGDDNDFDVIKSTGGGAYQMEATDGNTDAWFDLWTQARNIAVDPSFDNYMQIQGLNPDGTRNLAFPVLLDVDNLIDYMLGIFYTGDEDRGLSVPLGNNRPNNFFAVRNREGDRGFTFFAQDAEQSLESFHNTGGLNTNRVGPFNGSNQNTFIYSNPQWVHQDLANNQSYRERFADRVHKYFFNDGLLTPNSVIASFQSRADEIDLAIIAESARWGDAQVNPPLDKNDWLGALNVLYTQYFPFRGDIVLDQLRTAGLYPDLAAPAFAPQHGGEINLGFELTMFDPGSIIFTDTTVLNEFTPAQTLIPIDGSLNTSWTEQVFDDSSWTTGNTGIGYEDSPAEYNSLINTDIGVTPGSQPTSVYTRIDFSLLDDVEVDELIVLKMKFDDGFVAYLDGVEIARSNAPGAVGIPPAFNATALGSHGEANALAAQNFDVTDAINNSILGGLLAGNHVLAIHGLNVFETSTDMLILPELVVREVSSTGGAGPIYYTTDGTDPRDSNGLPLSATLYSTAITLNTSTVVKARIFEAGQWSALNEALFTVDVPLRITEIMYHPANPTTDEQNAGFIDDDDFEFLELTNTGAEELNLNGISLTDGVEFTFGPTVLPAGESLVIVRDIDAFVQRYGAGPTIAGEYGNGQEDAGPRKLANGGEEIRLEDPAGGLIQEFRYDDKTSEGWFDETDGDGFSLVLKDLNNASDLVDNWRSSATIGGSPGAADLDSLSADFNGDGTVDAADMAILLQNYGTLTGAYRSTGDADLDQKVGLRDLLLLKKQFNETISAPPAEAAAAAASLVVTINQNSYSNEVLAKQRNQIASKIAAVDRTLPEITTAENRSSISEDLNYNISQVRQARTNRRTSAVDQYHSAVELNTNLRVRSHLQTRTHRGHRFSAVRHNHQSSEDTSLSDL